MKEYMVIKNQIAINKERFIQRLQRNVMKLSCGCIIWLGGSDRDGYCRMNFRHNGKHLHLMVHRVFYTLMSKEPIPVNIEIDHICGNRACVYHLYPVSGAMNKRLRDRRHGT